MTQVQRSVDVRLPRALLIPAALLIGLLLVAGTALLAASKQQPFGIYSRDIAALSADAGASLPPLAGGLAMLNLMVWTSAASMAFLCALLWPPRRRWLLGFALLNGLLALDDALLLHDGIGPAMGVPEALFYVLYAVIAVLLLLGAFEPPVNARPRGSLLRTRPRYSSTGGRAFTLGLLLLGASTIADQTVHGSPLWEDAFKLLGALVWLTVPILELPSTRPPNSPIAQPAR